MICLALAVLRALNIADTCDAHARLGCSGMYALLIAVELLEHLNCLGCSGRDKVISLHASVVLVPRVQFCI